MKGRVFFWQLCRFERRIKEVWWKMWVLLPGFEPGPRRSARGLSMPLTRLTSRPRKHPIRTPSEAITPPTKLGHVFVTAYFSFITEFTIHFSPLCAFLQTFLVMFISWTRDVGNIQTQNINFYVVAVVSFPTPFFILLSLFFIHWVPMSQYDASSKCSRIIMFV